MRDVKALRATTIIPDALYVDREADRQLDAVIEEMGRPGYILVARQMGKTNLLLRMKRRRERQGDLALYVDLSTHFETARDLFRTIVDSLVDTLHVSSVRARIDADRTGLEIEANAEYDRHLRLFLEVDSHQRVVIILDEIDSLVGHTYSDRILSQIRSMYFARANHAIYEKLTYVLSGVAEPTDLIKDRNVSPFNIGEKIYLNDFGYPEVELLISKAELAFEASVVKEIFDWVNGNPRMTWDICSALEDLQRMGEVVTSESVEAVIRKLYLTRFDRPPIDHIRALAESDKQVRDGLISLLYGKGETLDDRARSKLYLAGITTASANESPKIKNRVIEFALSETWLLQVEAGKKGLLDAAAKRYENNNYAEAISLFNKFIEADGGDANLTDINLMQLGLSYYGLSRLEEAERAIEAALFKTRSAAIRTLLRFHLATAKLLSGSPLEAIPLLEDLARVPSEYQLQARIQIGSALTALSPIENADKIVEISLSAIDDLKENTELSDENAAELRVASYYNLARVYRATNQLDLAKRALRSARYAALPNQLPGLSFLFLEGGLEGEERRETLVEASKVVIAQRLPYSQSPASFAFRVQDMAILLSVSLELREQNIFENLLQIATNDRPSEAFSTLVSLAYSPIKPRQSAILTSLLRHALGSQALLQNATPKLRFDAARGWLIYAKDTQKDDAFRCYFEIARGFSIDEHLTGEDFIIISNRLSDLVQEHRHAESEEIISFVNERAKIIRSKGNSVYAFFLFQEMSFFISQFDQKSAKRRAREILILLNQTNLRDDNFAMTFAPIINKLRDAARLIIQETVSREIFRKIGRNEIVTVIEKSTGIRSVSKYKWVADKIASGELELIPTWRQ